MRSNLGDSHTENVIQVLAFPFFVVAKVNHCLKKLLYYICLLINNFHGKGEEKCQGFGM